VVVAAIVVLADGVFSQAHGTAAPRAGAAVRYETGGARASERGMKIPKPQFVRQAQRALRDLGYSPGPIDGIVGPQTHAALAKYQDAEQLPVTGELDLETMTRLDIYRRLFRARAS
jgi:peptidoglycan hydrolase-like protein with peptidoglycan-binding domain